MLADLVLWFLLTLVLLVAFAGIAVAMFSWQLNRANRVAPDVETIAPLVWLWAPTQPARLHRRLRTAVAPVDAIVPKPAKKRSLKRTTEPRSDSPTQELGSTLVGQAVTLDQQIVAVARLPRPQRRAHLRGLNPQVTEIERLSARIVAHQRRVAAEAFIPGAPVQTPPVVLAGLSHQLDLLDAAHQELQAIEQANGLLDPEALMAQTAPPRQAMVEPQPARPPEQTAPNTLVSPPPPRPSQPRTSSSG